MGHVGKLYPSQEAIGNPYLISRVNVRSVCISFLGNHYDDKNCIS